MAKLSITLKIAGSTYPFPGIEREDEELYRYAEKEVNRLFMANAHPNLLPKDQLALAALELAMENVRLKAGVSVDNDVERLRKLGTEIENYLKRNI